MRALTDAELNARIEELVGQMYLLSIPIELKLAGKDTPYSDNIKHIYEPIELEIKGEG